MAPLRRLHPPQNSLKCSGREVLHFVRPSKVPVTVMCLSTGPRSLLNAAVSKFPILGGASAAVGASNFSIPRVTSR